jgi:hypothetical protein
MRRPVYRTALEAAALEAAALEAGLGPSYTVKLCYKRMWEW